MNHQTATIVATAMARAMRIGRRDVTEASGRCALLEGGAARHVRVDGAGERVGASRQGRHVVHTSLDPGEHLTLENAGTTAILELDVVGRPRILVDERERERSAGRRGQRGLEEGDVLGMDDDVALGARWWPPGAAWLTGAAGRWGARGWRSTRWR